VDWPLFDLRLRCRDVRLRAMREAHLPHRRRSCPATSAWLGLG
jgi:hypothetical protein